MEWYYIVLITIGAYQLIGSILGNVFDAEKVLLALCFPVWMTLYGLTYPYRNQKEYHRRKSYFDKLGYGKFGWVKYFFNPKGYKKLEK